MSAKRKNKKIRKDRLLKLILVILFIIFIINQLFFRHKSARYKNITVIMDDSIVQMKNKINVDSKENIYMSLEDVKNIYDENIFYDEANKKMITTYNKHIAILNLDENKITINDSENTINGKLQYFDNKLYLPISDMGIVYDFEYNYSSTINSLVLENTYKEKKTSTLTKNAKLNDSKGIFSATFKKLAKDDVVTILDTSSSKYKVRTDDGIIGYISSSKLSEIKDVRFNMKDSNIENVNILKQYSEIKDNYEASNLDKNKKNVVMPKCFSIKSDKKVTANADFNTNKYKKYLDFIQKNDIEVWATITNDNVGISDIMVTYDDRKEVINNIYCKLIENNFKVVNIDFEKINDVNSFYRFLIELTPRLKESGIKTVVTYNSKMSEEKVEKIVDYLVKE